MKDKAIMCNAGHFDCEVNVAELADLAVSHERVRQNIEGYTMADGRKLYVLAEGRLVNLAAGDGHPAENHGLVLCYASSCCRAYLEKRQRNGAKSICIAS